MTSIASISSGSRIRDTAVCSAVLVSIWVAALVATPYLAHASAQPTTPTSCPPGDETLAPIDALNCVLAVVATAFDDLVQKATLAQTEIDSRRPLRIDQQYLQDIQQELHTLNLGQLRDEERVIADLDRFLVMAHVKYKKLKDNIGGKDPRIKDIDQNIHGLLDRRGRLNTMSAVVRGGFALADVATNRKQATHQASAPPRTAGRWPDTLSVLWGTKHWKDEEWPIDFSLSGQVATVPVPAVLSLGPDSEKIDNDTCHCEVQSATPDVSADLLALHQPALLYEAHFNVNMDLKHDAEFGFFVGGGQTRLLNDHANIGTEYEPRIVRPVETGTGLSAYRYELGLEYRLYDQDMDIVHHEKSLLSPVFAVGFGYRCDERFAVWPGVATSGGSCLGRSMFWSLDLDLRAVVDLRKTEDRGNTAFGVRMSAERVGGVVVPATSRVLLEFDVDLAELFVGL